MTAATAAARFMDVALRKTGPLNLSYNHKKHKWHVRDHVVSLLADFPAFNLTVAPFSDGGATMNLLNVHGVLSSASFSAQISLWIHPSHPFVGPSVYYLDLPLPFSGETTAGGYRHPYVDPSTGKITTPYLLTWVFPKSTLSGLVRNLLKIFTFWPPAPVPVPVPAPSTAVVSSLPSKQESIDRLTMYLLHDVGAIAEESQHDIQTALTILSILKHRATKVEATTSELRREKLRLERMVEDMERQTEEATNWLEQHKAAAQEEDDLVYFEAVDEASRVLAEQKAADESVDDTMRVLEEAALANGVVEVDVYLKHVRALAKEQFFHRSIQMEVLGQPRFRFF